MIVSLFFLMYLCILIAGIIMIVLTTRHLLKQKKIKQQENLKTL